MKTFNVAKLLAVVALLVAGSAFAGCATCPKTCTPCEKTCPAVKLPAPEVEWTTTVQCEKKPKFRYICRKEIIPCAADDAKVIKHKGCAEFDGVYDENGNPFMSNSMTEKVEAKKNHKRNNNR